MDTLQTCRTSCLKHSQHRRSALEYDLTSRWVWREIEDILFRPPGRPSRKPLVRYKSFRYQAESWSLTSLQHRLMKTGGSAGQARAVLLAAAGRGVFEPQAVRRHAAQDLGAAAAKRVALTGRGSTVFGSQRFRKEQCRPERRSARSINVCERMDEPWRLPAEVMCRVQREKTWYSGQRGCILSPSQGQNGNPG